MNGFIPNTLNHAAVGVGGQMLPQHQQQQQQQQAPGGPPQPQPVIIMNGAIPNQHHHQQHHHQQQQHHQNHVQQPNGFHHHHQQQQQHPVVHYVQHPNPQHQQGQPQLIIPNGNVIQLAPSPPPPPQPGQMIGQQQQQQQGQIYVQRQPRMMMVNGGGPMLPNQSQQQQRMIRLTTNGTYATTVQITGNGNITGNNNINRNGLRQQPTIATALILTKQPPPKCLLCCLACCGLESLWFNPNFHFSRVIALICNILVDLLMILCLLSTNWLTTLKYRQGLWQYCIDVDSPRPLPFGLDDHDGCHWGRNAAYIKLSGFFAVACFLLAIVATILTSFGLSSRDPNKKYTFYRFALYINLGALLAIIVSLTLYPAFFYSELHHTNMVPSNRPHWYFGWAYGVGWGAAIFLVGAILLLVCDKETEEIYYQERTIVHAGNGGGANNHLLQHHHHHQQLTNHHNSSHQSIKA
ncbi:uncharacterized protein LOC124498413 [Dermatophagoides farinae]|uniref:Transmembrane protein 47-like protein n=1 Tax=Dermatophagoides farinae TaxID=6954 RepID=A0A922ICD0_DERFA|nr:uncharacterized protein LOC124498413 [Dermatophagoides farinae]KAH7636499.1 transmembrane protein 47-like protein [Dermatophagoides farinae]KAH9527721.1 hypothetical protein DERF_001727 [Dermatophagoides farinae]